MEKLPGDYIAGFVDGEGCFYIHFRRDVRHDRKNKPVYFYWDIGFAVVLRVDDKEILEKIKQTLDCGRISISRKDQARFEVTDITDLSDKIVPFFDKYSLRAKKRFDYILWKEALGILRRNRQVISPGQRGFSKIKWKTDDLERLKKIKEEMGNYKSKRPPWKWLSTEVS